MRKILSVLFLIGLIVGVTPNRRWPAAKGRRGAGPHHLPCPRGHRDAVRGRRRSAGRGRQQLRPFPAGGRAPAASGRAARSRRRTDPLAPAGSGRRLPQPDRRPDAAGTGRNPLVRVLARRAGGRHGDDAATRRANRVRYGGGTAGDGDRAAYRGGPRSLCQRPSGRRRWSSSDATRSRCAASTRAVASDSSTTW